MWGDEYDDLGPRYLKTFTIKSRQTGVSNYIQEVLMDCDAFESEYERQPWQKEMAEQIDRRIQKQMHNMIVNNEGKISTKEQEEANKMRDNPLFGSF